MKRILITTVLILAVAGLIVVALPFLLSSDAVRERIVAHVSGLTGQNVSFRGDPSVSFSPFLGIEISELHVAGNDNQPLLKIEKVKGKLGFLPAIFGNVELQDFELLRPRLVLRRRLDGDANWQLEGGHLKEAYDAAATSLQSPESASSFEAGLGTYRISDGVVEYIDEIDGTREVVTNINAVLDWQTTASPLRLNGTAVMRNENGSVALTLQTPMKIMAGGESPVSLNFSSEPLAFVFDGSANTISNLFAKGALKASTPSIARLSDFLRFDFGETASVVGNWEAEGVFEGTANMALLSEARIAVGENRATGVVGLSRTETGTAKLDGTLAFGEIDLSGYLQGDAEAVNERIPAPGNRNLDVDLRISANAMKLGQARMENVAASITSSNNAWKFDIGNATGFGGTIVASLGSTGDGDKAQLVLKLTTRDTDLTALAALGNPDIAILSGTGNIVADLRTPLPLAQLNLLPVNGEVSINSRSGTIRGIDLQSLFGKVDSSESAANENLNLAGETGYEELSINVFLNNSRASVSKASILAGDSRIQLHGNADMLSGTLALSAQQVSEEGPGPNRLIIGGTFANPLVSLKNETPPSPRQQPGNGPADEQDPAASH